MRWRLEGAGVESKARMGSKQKVTLKPSPRSPRKGIGGGRRFIHIHTHRGIYIERTASKGRREGYLINLQGYGGGR